MKKLLFVLATAALLFTGCVKDISEALLAARSVGPEPTLSEIAIENVQEKNEYSFERAQIVADSVFGAWKKDSVLKTMLGGYENLESIELEPTDLYVRFLVTDSLGYDALQSLPDSLELFDFPLHLDLTSEQRDAFSNDTSSGGYWFYTTVGCDFDFSLLPASVRYEELDKVYIQRLETEGLQLPDEFWEAVMDAMLGINDDPKTRASKKWFPQAKIKYVLDHPTCKGDTIGLQRVRVRVWQGVNWAKVYTNADGETGNIKRNSGLQFKKPVNYQIIWETPRWNIRSGDVGQARTDGPEKSDNAWTKTFKGTGLHEKYATVHRALDKYAYRSNNYTLTKDLTINDKYKLNTAVVNGTGSDNGRFLWGNLNPIKVWVKNSEIKENWQLEETMYHELGHSSHWRALRADEGNRHNVWLTGNNDTGEPYAEFVSNCFMRSVYPGHIQEYRLKSSGYNGLGEWLWYQGFSPKQIETIMCEERERDEDKWSKTDGAPLNPWRKRAKSYNVTDPKIVDAIFDSRWSNWRFNAKELIIAPETVFPGEVTITRHPDANIPTYIYQEFGVKNKYYPIPESTSISSHSWDISNMDGVSIVRQSSQRIVLNFTKPGTYTISYDANLSSNVRYSYPKTIKVVNAAPVIVASESGVPLWRDEYGKYPVYYNNNITFEVIDPVPGLYYEWEYNMNTDTLGEGLQGKPKITTSVGRVGNANPTAYMRCRAIDDAGVATEWSNRIEMPLMF